MLEKEYFNKHYNDPRGQFSLESKYRPGYFFAGTLNGPQMTAYL